MEMQPASAGNAATVNSAWQYKSTLGQQTMNAFVTNEAAAVIQERSRIIIQFGVWPGDQNEQHSYFSKNAQEFKMATNNVDLGFKFHLKDG